MIELKRLNVVKIVDSELKAQTLESQGFKRIIQNEEPAQEPVADSLESLEIDDLKAYAEDHGIDLGKATSKDGILEKIHAAQN